jgi:hypothetical protein
MEGNVRAKHTDTHWYDGRYWSDEEWQARRTRPRRVGDDPAQLELTAAIVEAQARGAEQADLDALLQRKLNRAKMNHG